MVEPRVSQARRKLPHNKATKHTKILEQQRVEEASMRINSKVKIRLDQYVCSLALDGLQSRNQLKRQKVEVFKDGTLLKWSYLVENGEQLKIRWQESKPFDAYAPVSMDLQIIYEDEDIILLDKPSGLAVHGALGLHEPSLVQGLCARYENFVHNFESEFLDEASHLVAEFRPGIVHRLDKDTSGILVVARNTKSLRNLSRQFARREVQKIYYAITYGCPSQSAGCIRFPLRRNSKSSSYYTIAPQSIQSMSSFATQTNNLLPNNNTNRKMNIRHAVTKYQVLRSWQLSGPKLKKLNITGKPILSLLRLQPQTGRTHQLRVHLKHLGCPIVGDPIYGNLGLDREWCESIPNFGLMLHASRLQFTHPQYQHMMNGKAVTPERFRSLFCILNYQ